ncbi:MAG: OmpA family protein [Pseudomonadota bacterium]|nr:OmpA family protein [Pseudomonadota bacterium]MDQ2704509.1 OmpA family protein [Pseudomonadota bacterium]
MTIALKIARAGVFAGLLAFAASCSTSGNGDGIAGINPGDTLPPQAGGYTDDPAAGFENVQPGTEPDFILSAGRRIYFTQGSAALDETAKATIDNQIAFLQKYPKWYAKLQGFADDPGSNAQNVQLSQQRADAVMAYMISSGIPAERLWAKGYGKDREVRACSERACKVQNRRVVTNLRLQREE